MSGHSAESGGGPAKQYELTVALLVVFLMLSALADSALMSAQTRPATEYQVKAAFLFNFAKFVEWPLGTFTGPTQTFDICVYGPDPFGPVLEKELLGKSVGDRRVALGRAMRVEDLAGCRVIFVGAWGREPVGELFRRLKDHAILLVGEADGFAAAGGTIQFTIEDNRVRFVINPDAADRAGLKISSKLLALAKIVHDSHRSLAGISPK
ncbi:MAG TPA: YfiR family protein [Candidatus Acidoferrum sp.]|nr:YfiR family protein [Candidatus Acidoferrum sp.]